MPSKRNWFQKIHETWITCVHQTLEDIANERHSDMRSSHLFATLSWSTAIPMHQCIENEWRLFTQNLHRFALKHIFKMELVVLYTLQNSLEPHLLQFVLQKIISEKGLLQHLSALVGILVQHACGQTQVLVFGKLFCLLGHWSIAILQSMLSMTFLTTLRRNSLVGHACTALL